MTTNNPIAIEPRDFAPLQDWFHDLRARFEGWSRSVKETSVQEWAGLQRTVSKALSTQRVEQVLRDFLTRVGVRSAELDDTVEQVMIDLRHRIITFRKGETIEHYQEYLVTPPQIQL